MTKRKSASFNRFISVLASVVLAVGLLPVSAFASDNSGGAPDAALVLRTAPPETDLSAKSAPEGCIVFTSDEPFTVSLGPNKDWDGTIEYSLDNGNWNTYAAGTEIRSGTGKAVYFRGTGNKSFFEWDSGVASFSLESADDSTVSCSGNIENLLNYQAVTRGEHPEMDFYAFRLLFYNCTSLASAPELPATSLAESCYSHMFDGCTSLTSAPELPATSLAKGCYSHMFEGCTSLAFAPELPATSLAESCYSHMFEGCTSLASAPELPATSLASNCYQSMFYGCTSLASAPALPAASSADYCYRSMFEGCTSLASAPELPATSLARSCYSRMFYGCTSLVSAPELPATSLADYCYSHMFYGCTSLVSAPELPATSLADSCYRSMFEGCTSLVSAPELPAKTLAKYCYESMFKNSGVKVSDTIGPSDGVHYGAPYRIPSEGTGTGADNALEDIFAGTGGPFKGTPEINTTYYLPTAPAGCIVFTSDKLFTVSLGPDKDWDGTIEYSLDNGNWNTYAAGTEIRSETGRAVYFRGTGNRGLCGPDSHSASFYLYPANGSTVSCSGNIENLLNYQAVMRGEHPAIGMMAFHELFYGCRSLASAPDLPATKLADYCYEGMFENCASLVSAPALPATALTGGCYLAMFSGCTSLTSAPELPATVLADRCYSFMFSGCTSLTSAPELPATVLADHCYSYMFSGCTSLVSAPVLPATELADHCYNYMFDGCTSLVSAPELPAECLVRYCYSGMFSGCTSLASPPELPATKLAEGCYEEMFKGSGVKVSDKTGYSGGVFYGAPYRIPSEGEGTGADNALKGMFAGTGGPFKGTPDINTTYYLPATTIDAPTAVSGLVYSGTQQTGVESGEGYVLAGDVAATDAGNYTATATLKDGYAWSDGATGAKDVPWKISPADISVATISADDQVYDGTELQPAPTVTWKGNVLKNDTDYTVSYKDNVNAGPATVIVKGKGNFEDKATGKFEITPITDAVTVTVVGADSTVEYDGAEHAVSGYEVTGISNPLYTESDFSKPAQDAAVATAKRTVEGTTNMALSAADFANTSANFSNVAFSVTPGYQKIEKSAKAVAIGSSTKSWTYDAATHTDEVYTVTYGGAAVEADSSGKVFTLPTGDKVTITATAAGVQNVADTAKKNNTFTYVLDNASQYSSVSTTFGALSITPAPVTITAKSEGFAYDGQAHSNAGYDVKGLVGDDAVSAVVAGSITFPTESPVANKVTSYEFTAGTPGNYSVTTEDGELSMANASRAITITAASASKAYDGSALTAPGVEVTSGELFSGDRLVAEAAGSASDVADTKAGNNPVKAGYKVMHGDVDVTGSYVVTAQAGTLTITPKSATVKTGSASKGFDGTALTCAEASIDGLVDGETATVAATGSLTDAGESANTYSIEWGTAQEGNYTIADDLGELVVTKRPVTITGVSETKDYTGSEIEISAVTVDGLVEGHTHNVAFSAKGTEVGEHEGTITDKGDVVITDAGGADVTANYDVSVANGKLTIQQDPTMVLTVSLEGGSFVYDGKAHALPTGATTNAASGATAIEYSRDGEDWTEDLSTLTATDVADSCTVRVRATNPNYANTAEGSAELAIEPAKATITVANASKVEGEADPAFTGTVEGLVAEGDLGEVTYKRTNADEAAGTYKGVITAEYTANANYDVAVENGDFTIEAKEKAEYKAVSGAGSTFTQDSDEALAFTFKRLEGDSAALEHLKGIEVDGKAVPKTDSSGKANWTSRSGSVIVELQPSYLDTLSVGKHTLTALFDDGDPVSVEFSVAAKKAPSSNTGSKTSTGSSSAIPKTGDITGGAVAALSGAAICALLLVLFALSQRKRRKPAHIGKHARR